MSLWDITVLFYGKITAPKSAVTPGLDSDLIFDAPYLGFLLQNGTRNILVDTGIADHFFVDGKAWGNFPAIGGQYYVKKSLKDLGLRPEDIDTIVYTHLHNDHAANASLFKNARIFFQKDEWATLLDPLPIMNVRRDYDPALINELKGLNCIKTDGDFELVDGIKCYLTPGHTPGSQSLTVQTKNGVRVLVGDHWHLSCMAFSWHKELIDMEGNSHTITPAPEVYGRFIPSSLIYNYYDYYDSCNKIMSLIPEDKPEYIIPGHDPSLVLNGVQ